MPSGVARELVLEAENLPHPQAGHAGFQCLVDIEGAKMVVGARIEAGRFVVFDKTTVRTSVRPSPSVHLPPDPRPASLRFVVTPLADLTRHVPSGRHVPATRPDECPPILMSLNSTLDARKPI